MKDSTEVKSQGYVEAFMCTIVWDFLYQPAGYKNKEGRWCAKNLSGRYNSKGEYSTLLWLRVKVLVTDMALYPDSATY